LSGGRRLPRAGECPNPDPDLIAQGWVRRSQIDPTRVEEVSELYSSLGHEVRLEQASPEQFADACRACVLSSCESYLVVYTRKL